MRGSNFSKAVLKAKIQKKEEAAATENLLKAQQRARNRQNAAQKVRQRSDRHIPESIKVMLAQPPPLVDKERSRPGTRERDEDVSSRTRTSDGTDTLSESKKGKSYRTRSRSTTNIIPGERRDLS